MPLVLYLVGGQETRVRGRRGEAGISAPVPGDSGGGGIHIRVHRLLQIVTVVAGIRGHQDVARRELLFDFKTPLRVNRRMIVGWGGGKARQAERDLTQGRLDLRQGIARGKSGLERGIGSDARRPPNCSGRSPVPPFRSSPRARTCWAPGRRRCRRGRPRDASRTFRCRRGSRSCRCRTAPGEAETRLRNDGIQLVELRCAARSEWSCCRERSAPPW